MNCPQVSQSNGTISYNVDEYFLIPEKSPVSKLSEYWCCQSEIIYIDHTSKQSIILHVLDLWLDFGSDSKLYKLHPTMIGGVSMINARLTLYWTQG